MAEVNARDIIRNCESFSAREFLGKGNGDPEFFNAFVEQIADCLSSFPGLKEETIDCTEYIVIVYNVIVALKNVNFP